jgi:hypothetical protein
MKKNKTVVNDIKDFFYQLETILEDYCDKTNDNVVTLKKIEDLKEAAEDAGIQVNIGDNILNNITPSSSYC